MHQIDLDAYFARIGYTGTRKPTLENLQSLHALHPAAITFENLDPLLGRPISLEPTAIAEKLVGRKRGGYCFEQNTLFESVLRSLGFSVSTLAARVQWNLPPGTITPRYHMVLRIDLQDGTYIADVGFGRLTLTAPLRLVADVEQSTPHGPHRLVAHGTDFQLQTKLHDGWAPIYRLSLEEQAPADWEVANWYTSTSPKSVFTNSLMVARPVGDRRYGLFNNDLRIHYSDGRTEKRSLSTPDELASVLLNDFAIILPEGANELLTRLTRRA
jgi:N-hydroxyarylamine O-acetyltransferase